MNSCPEMYPHIRFGRFQFYATYHILSHQVGVNKLTLTRIIQSIGDTKKFPFHLKGIGGFMIAPAGVSLQAILRDILDQ